MPAKLRMLFSLGFCAALLALSAAPSSAVTLPIGSGGIDAGFACLSSAGSCSGNADFSTDDRGAITGSITVNGTGLTTADLVLNVSSTSMAGFFSGISGLDFSGITLVATIPVMASGSMATLFQVIPVGAAAGQLSGTYDQGSGPLPIPGLSAQFANLQCLLSVGVGQCGVQIGRPNFALNVGGQMHDFVWIADLTVVPEPGTGLLVGLGLAAMATMARRREV